MIEDSPSPASATPAKPWFQVVDDTASRRIAGLFSVTVSVAVIAAVIWQLRLFQFDRLVEMIPSSPLFWLVFALTYMAGPLGDWIIFHRLWGLPAAGVGALIRKMVSNELLLGYLGDAQFYGWARARLSMVAAPFGAVKDVAILSAVTGNAVTMILLLFAWPLVASGQLGVATRDAYVSLGVVLITSFAIFLFRRQLFSLPKHDLYFVSVIHVLRIAVALAGSALMWHLILKDVAITLWIVLATLRMLISRLPLLPNKDVVFAGITVFLLGHDTEVADLIALMTMLTLATHLVMGALFGILGFFDTEKAK